MMLFVRQHTTRASPYLPGHTSHSPAPLCVFKISNASHPHQSSILLATPSRIQRTPDSGPQTPDSLSAEARTPPLPSPTHREDPARSQHIPSFRAWVLHSPPCGTSGAFGRRGVGHPTPNTSPHTHPVF